MPRPSYRTCDGVSDVCPVEATTYGYYPDLAGNAFFAAWFGLLLIAQLVLGFKNKTWTYMIALGLGTFGELMGYIGRLLMHNNPWNSPAFQMQICCLVLAPSFIAAAIYLTLKHLVIYFGPEYSRLKARLYPWVFVGCDFGSIVLQAIGGGVAASAGNSENPKLLDAGDGLIVAGIAFQVATMAVCGLLVLNYFLRFKKGKKSNRPTEVGEEKQSAYFTNQGDVKTRRNLKFFCIAVAIAYLTVLIRCIYRIPEMAGGWGNPLMRKEDEFLVLDGAMIAIACLVLTVMHPGVFFPPMRFASKKAQAQQ